MAIDVLYAAAHGDLSVLKKAHKQGVGFPSDVVHFALDCGNYDCAAYALNHGCLLDESSPDLYDYQLEDILKALRVPSELTTQSKVVNTLELVKEKTNDWNYLVLCRMLCEKYRTLDVG